MITVDNLTKYFGDIRAVEDASFRVEQGQTMVIVGTSGCGKTTLLKMINRLVEPTRGTVTINDENVMDLNPTTLRRKIGYVIQEIGLFPHYTVRQNVSVVPELLEWHNKKIQQRVHELLEQVGLDPDQYGDSYPHQLSGGQQQRVGVARALAADPPIILMDEPFGALDLITRQKIRQDFMYLEALKNKMIVMVTHDVSEAFELGDKICLMDDGYIQQIGDAETLLFEPANDFVNEFFQADRYELGLAVISLHRLAEQNISINQQKAETTFQAQEPVGHLIDWYAQHSKDSDIPVGIQTDETTLYTDLTHIMSAYNHMVGAMYSSQNE